MKEAIWKVTAGDFAFHGTRSKQLTLDINNPDFEPLKDALRNEFRGKGWTRIEQIVEFVGSDRTDYYSGQVKTKTLRPMEGDGQIDVHPASRIRKKTYPDGARIRFL